MLETIIEQSLHNQQAVPSETSIGRAVLGETFDPTSDSTIRGRVREIRIRLSQYYRNTGAGDPIEVQIPAGGYRARFVRRKTGPIEIPAAEKNKPAPPMKIGVVPFLVLAEAVPEEFGFNAALLLAQLLGSAPDLAVHGIPVLAGVNGHGAGLREAFGSLGLGQAIQCTICVADGSLKATVTLTETASQTIVWSSGFECDTSDFGFLGRIADAIATRLANVEPGSLRYRIMPANVVAASHYCQGLRNWAERTPSSLAEAEKHFRLAVAADPRHAETYSGLAECALFRAIVGQRPAGLAPVALEMAAKAVGCDPESANAHAVLGAVRTIFQFDWAGAEEEFLEAARLNPDSTALLGWYSGHLAVLGRPDEAIQAATRLEVNEAHSLFITAHVAKVLYYCGDYEAAISRFRSILALVPTMDLAHGLLGLALCAQGDMAQGLFHLQRGAELTGRCDVSLGPLAHYLAQSGKVLQAEEIALELERRSAVRYVPATQIAMAWAGLGRVDEAFHALDRAAEEKDFFLTLLKIWAPLQGLRSDPRFAALLQRVGLE